MPIKDFQIQDVAGAVAVNSLCWQWQCILHGRPCLPVVLVWHRGGGGGGHLVPYRASIYIYIEYHHLHHLIEYTWLAACQLSSDVLATAASGKHIMVFLIYCASPAAVPSGADIVCGIPAQTRS